MGGDFPELPTVCSPGQVFSTICGPTPGTFTAKLTELDVRKPRGLLRSMAQQGKAGQNTGEKMNPRSLVGISVMETPRHKTRRAWGPPHWGLLSVLELRHCSRGDPWKSWGGGCSGQREQPCKGLEVAQLVITEWKEGQYDQMKKARADVTVIT